jgi:hypothetical protein
MQHAVQAGRNNNLLIHLPFFLRLQNIAQVECCLHEYCHSDLEKQMKLLQLKWNKAIFYTIISPSRTPTVASLIIGYARVVRAVPFLIKINLD